MRNVLFIAREFPPQAGVGVVRSAKFAKYLPEFGYRPIVLTGVDALRGIQEDRSLLSGLEDTTIVRCAERGRRAYKALGRMKLNRLLSFCVRPDLQRVTWVPGAEQAAVRIAAEHRLDLIYTSAPPYSSVLLGSRLRRRLGLPWLADYRDPWTNEWNCVWPTRLHHWWETCQERRALARADRITIATPTMAELLLRRYPEFAGKVDVIPNGFDREDIDAVLSAGAVSPWPELPPECLRIGYAGTLADYGDQPFASRSPLTRLAGSLLGYRCGEADRTTGSPYYLLKALRRLLDESPELQGRVHVAFAGVFGPRNTAMVDELGLRRQVSILGWLPNHEGLRLLADSDVLFLPALFLSRSHRGYIQNAKAFEYLALGKPILATVPPGDLHDLIERSHAGWCADPYETSALTGLLRQMVGLRARGELICDADREYIAQFHRRELTRRLASYFDRLMES